MSIERDLKNYRTIAKEIESLKKKLEKAKRHVVDSVQSAADFPYWKHTIMIEGDLYPAEMQKERERLARLTAKKARIERFVAEVEDYKLQRMIQLHFLSECDGERITWEDTADAMGDGSNGDACRMRVKRFLEKR